MQLSTAGAADRHKTEKSNAPFGTFYAGTWSQSATPGKAIQQRSDALTACRFFRNAVGNPSCFSWFEIEL